MSSPELDSLIIEHLVDLDRAGKRIAAIEHRLFSAMNAKAEQWARRQNWKGEFEIPENGNWYDWKFRLAPTEWRKGGDNPKDAFDCYFETGVGAGDTLGGKAAEPWNYVTRLCSLEGGQMGLRLVTYDTIRIRKWQGIVDLFRDDIASTNFIVDSQPSFFLGFRINPIALAAALRDDDPDLALDPFTAALDNLLEARPVFDKLVAYLRTSTS